MTLKSFKKESQLQWCLEFTANTRLHRHYNTQCRGHCFVLTQKGTNSWTGPQTVEMEKVQYAYTLKESTV